MSIENLKKFGQLTSADETVRERVKAIGKTDIQGIMDYAAECGLPFDAEDLRALAQESGFKEDELDERQLRSIAGGVVTTTVALLGIAAKTAAAVAGGVVAGAALATADDW